MSTQFQNLFVVICCLCCFLHLFTICYEYFLSEVNQFVSFDIDKRIEIPQLSICFEIIKFQSFRNLVLLELNESNLSYQDTFIKLDGKVTLQQLWKILPKPEKLIKKIFMSIHLENNTYKTVNIKYSAYFFEPFYCIAFGPNSKEPTYYNHWGVDSSEQDINYFTIFLKRYSLRVHKSIFLFLHAHGTLLYDAAPKLKTLDINNNIKGCKFSFEISRYSLLPYPYSSQCFDYKKIGFATQSLAITRCLQNVLRILFNRNLPFTSAYPASRVFMGYGFILMVRKNVTLFQRIRNLQKICRNKYYKPDCEQSHFDITNLEILSGISDFIEISMNLVYHPSLHLITKERVELSDTIIYSASILGIWFGFSIAFDLPKAASFFFKLIYNLTKTFSFKNIKRKLTLKFC